MLINTVNYHKLGHIRLILLLERADTDLWAKTAACLILTQNYHNDETHNIRLAIDPWSGIVYPIIIDPLIVDSDGTFHNKNKGLPLETSANLCNGFSFKYTLFNSIWLSWT